MDQAFPERGVTVCAFRLGAIEVGVRVRVCLCGAPQREVGHLGGVNDNSLPVVNGWNYDVVIEKGSNLIVIVDCFAVRERRRR